jgi:AcrR family transcriptional regulator
VADRLGPVIATPWGDSNGLRERKLRPGGAQSREEAAERQRARIYGALVASTAERGYQGTRLEDVVEISGVSMRSFYELFPDKEAAFVATLELLLKATVEQVLFARTEERWESGMGERLAALAELIEAQAPAARMCLLEAYVAGPRAAELLEQEILRAEELVRERLAESPDRAAMPPEMAVAAVGGLLEVLRGHLIRRAGNLEDTLPPVLSLLFEFRPPTRPLRSAARAPEVRPEAAEASDHAERAVRAFEALLAEGRYGELTMEQVARRTKMSRRTLYANFSDRERLLAAAIDSACAQVSAVTVPAYHRHDIPVEGLRAAIGALLAFLGSRPNLAHLLLVASFEGGEPALQRRSRGLRPLRSLLRGISPTPPGSAMTAIELEALLGGVLSLMRRRLLEAGAGGLVALGPICTYIVLAPLVGAEQATVAAEGRAYRRDRPDLYASTIAQEVDSETSAILRSFGGRARSATEVAREAGMPKARAEALISGLLGTGVIETIDAPSEDGETSYLARWPLIPTGEWAELDRGEREVMSAEVRRIIQIDVEEAFAAGTFDSRPERHLVRMPVWLDEQGWQEMNGQLELTTRRCLEIEERARERLKAEGTTAEGFPARILLVSFEAAHSSEAG